MAKAAQPGVTVTLPVNGARRHELLHELAWINLLDPGPGGGQSDGLVAVDVSVEGEIEEPEAVQRADGTLSAFLAEVITRSTTVRTRPQVPDELALDALVTTDGWCGSDLFVQCAKCEGDRVVIEIKGPTAQVNYSRSRQMYQTERYRQVYADNPDYGCACTGLQGAPYFVLLDARSRSRDAIMSAEHVPLQALRDWVCLGYEDVLRLPPFEQQPVARWLLVEY